MRIAISGTYSTGKTTTSIALSHLTGIPRTHAKTMREILPLTLPGKRLEDCTGPELIRLGIIRYAERAVHESHLPAGFVSDGSALHEWVYGHVRTQVGIVPTDGPLDATAVEQAGLLGDVIANMGAVVTRHARDAYDVFVHLPVEFPLVTDGHRPVSERFRALSDEMLLATLAAHHIPHHVIGGSITERLDRIVDVLRLPTRMRTAAAAEQARREVAAMDTTSETTRAASHAGAGG